MMGKVFRTDYMALLYCLYAVCHLLVGGAAVSPEFFFKCGGDLQIWYYVPVKLNKLVILGVSEGFCNVFHIHFLENAPFAGLNRINRLAYDIGNIVHCIALGR